MIKEIKITNFYSFSEETIILQPDVNILIGINGSGKSNFFKAVRLLKEGVAGKGLRAHLLEDLGGFDNILFKGAKVRLPEAICFAYHFDTNILKLYGYPLNEEVVYEISIHKIFGTSNYYVFEQVKIGMLFHLDFHSGEGGLMDNINNWVSYKNFIEPTELALSKIFDFDRFMALSSLRKSISDILIYDYFDTSARSAIRRAALATSDRRLNANGGNLTQIINTIKINYKESYKKIVELLKEVNANFTGFDYHIMGGSNIELMLDEKGLDSSIHVSSVSDGTLKYLCLLAILYNPEKGKFICIDEPEAGLHPDMIRSIANAIKDATEQTTLVISTHSVDLLNYFRVENLQVFEKDEHNATRVVTYKEEQFEGWYETFNVGQMWVAGDFGGVRYGG
jgi:predicted ATPase